MKIIKEVTAINSPASSWGPSRRCAIRTNSYSSSVEHLLMLYEEAKKDFPHLDAGDVEVVLYAGRTHARTFGVEFNISDSASIPVAYSEVSHLDPTH